MAKTDGWIGIARGVPVGIACVVAPSFAIGAIQSDKPPIVAPQPLTAPEIAAAGLQLATAIQAELATRPVTTSAEDQEAVIVFVISQGRYREDVIAAALDVLDVRAVENLTAAVANVRLALIKKRVRRGTAALAGGGVGFSIPGINPGGGSSNYTQ
jgi:hypothetical protein